MPDAGMCPVFFYAWKPDGEGGWQAFPPDLIGGAYWKEQKMSRSGHRRQIYREMLSIADEHGGKLPNRVVIFGDEIGTIPKIESL